MVPCARLWRSWRLRLGDWVSRLRVTGQPTPSSLSLLTPHSFPAFFLICNNASSVHPKSFPSWSLVGRGHRIGLLLTTAAPVVWAGCVAVAIAAARSAIFALFCAPSSADKACETDRGGIWSRAGFSVGWNVTRPPRVVARVRPAPTTAPPAVPVASSVAVETPTPVPDPDPDPDPVPAPTSVSLADFIAAEISGCITTDVLADWDVRGGWSRSDGGLGR